MLQMGALCYFVRTGDLAGVKHLLEEGGADIEAASKDGRTPLHVAAGTGHMDVMKYLWWSMGLTWRPSINTREHLFMWLPIIVTWMW